MTPPPTNPFSIQTTELAHYGIIHAVLKRISLSTRLGDVLPKKSRHHKISHAEAVIALIYNLLGHGSGRLYSAKTFFKSFPIDELFGKTIDPKSFNPSTLSRTLDVISDYGADQFFLDTAFKIAMDHKLLNRELHLDSTSVSFYGKFKKARRGRKDKELRLDRVDMTYGHSKAKRPDLIQVILSMITGGSSGIPYWINTHSGNTNDKELFQNIIFKMTNFLKNYAPMKVNYFVADSSLYSREYLLNHSHRTSWISRVPESISRAKEILEVGHKGSGWISLAPGVKYKPIHSEYCGILQRWLVVHSHKSYYKEKMNFINRFHDKETLLCRDIKSLNHKLFLKKEDAQEKVSQLKSGNPYHKIKTTITPHYEGIINGELRYMNLIGHKIEVEVERNNDKIQRAINRKGKYIIATNIKDWEKSDQQIYEAYGRRNANIESCFRQIKSAQFLGKGIYFKNIKRIQALMSIVALSLFVNNIAQLMLRKGLTSTKQTIKNFANKDIKNPTLQMVGRLLRRVSIIKITTEKYKYQKVIELCDDLKKVINIFGPEAQKIYGYP